MRTPPGWDKWSPEQREAFLTEIEYKWRLWARPDQVIHWEEDHWDVWMNLSGRGAGKTRMGSEAVREYCDQNPGARVACVSPTLGACRDVQYEGDSGLLSVTPEQDYIRYNRSLGQIEFANGSKTFWYSGQEPEKFRGPQHDLIWFDELCAYDFPEEVWDMARMGLRLGDHPRILITTTPKPTKLIRDLVERAQAGDPRIHLISVSTFANSANLPESTLEELRQRYEGTSLGRQELYAEIILEAEGALWSLSMIDDYRVSEIPDLVRIVVAVDPSVSSTGAYANETGIVVVGRDAEGHLYVLDDRTVSKATPEQWAQATKAAYEDWEADTIVIEKNQGGDMVKTVMRSVDEDLPVRTVVASRGKQTRAEPISALYEQGKVHHTRVLKELEDQMTTWIPYDTRQRNSPDRLDALVWAATELNGGAGQGEFFGRADRLALPSPTAYRTRQKRKIPAY